VSEKLEFKSAVVLPDGRMDTQNAAAYLGLSVKTLAMWRSQGIGPKFLKLGKVFYYREDLDAWLKSGVVNSTAQARLLSNALEA
jgi:predicted DNA-binding transcriptional regulator AlpA